MHTTSGDARWVVPGVGDLWRGEEASPDAGSPVDCPCLASGWAARPSAACKARVEAGAHAVRASTSDSRRLSERNDRRE